MNRSYKSYQIINVYISIYLYVSNTKLKIVNIGFSEKDGVWMEIIVYSHFLYFWTAYKYYNKNAIILLFKNILINKGVKSMPDFTK